MNLYLLWQEENNDYDTYDSCIVCAENMDEARLIHPNSNYKGYSQKDWESDLEWATSPENVHCRLIGKAESYIPKGVILASFNAG